MANDHANATRALSAGERLYRLVEFVALFFAIPGLLAWGEWSSRDGSAPFRVPLFLLLYSAFVVCLVLLCRDASFDRRSLWNARAGWAELGRIMRTWVVLALAMAAVVWLIRPTALFNFPKRDPLLWAAVMVGYPVLSVYPQNVAYRCFIFHRYEGLFGRGAGMVLASAAAFGFAHVILQNWVAPALTFVGGLLFARTYARSRSAFAASVEHALYGCAVFTIGLGMYLYKMR